MTAGEEAEEIDESRRTSFGSAAELYERIRPGYPEQLFADIASYAGLTADSRLLEIGAGTGRATRPLAERGFRITALEPSGEMAEVLENQLSGLRNVRIEGAKFEDFAASSESFDLIYAAQSFHWVPKEVGYTRSHDLLKRGGALALIGNSTYFEDWPPEIRAGFDKAYDKFFPGSPPAAQRQSIEAQQAGILESLRGSRLFGDVRAHSYAWTRSYSSADYVNLLDTYSECRVMEPAVRDQFFSEMRNVIDGFGGVLVYPYASLLYLGRKL